MALPDPVFPPLLAGHMVDPPVLPFIEACRRAASKELGAGDLIWSSGIERAEMAVVLEPDIPAAPSQQMAPLMMVAAGDCLGSLLPPQIPLTYRWPDRVLLNGAEVARMQLAMADIDSPADVPDWLVVGLAVQLTFPVADREPGEMAQLTALAEEGGGDLDRTEILQSLSAHVLSWLHTWQTEGFRPVADAFMARLDRENGKVSLVSGKKRITGKPLGLDEGAGLLIKPERGAARTLRLAGFMATPERVA